jgi:iron complex outermembrane receptor protein
MGDSRRLALRTPSRTHKCQISLCGGARAPRTSIRVVAFGGVLFFLTGAVATAQVNDTQTSSQSAPASTKSTSASASESLETIVVTARKREERLEDVPVSITAFSANAIENAHIQTVDNIGALVPNLNMSIGQDPDIPNVVLRGIGSNDVTQGTGFYVDDVQQFGGAAGVRLEDIDRIEILRGPQGTLYGGSNIGGAIKYVTKLPTEAPTAFVSFEGGEWGTRNFTGIVSGPIVGDTLLGRLTVFDDALDGWIRNPTLNNTRVNGGSFSGGRLTLEYKGDATTALLYLYATRHNTDALDPLYIPENDQTYSTTVTYDYPPSNLIKTESAVLHIDRRFDGATLTSISAGSYTNRTAAGDFDLSAFPIAYGQDSQKQRIYSEELRLASSNASKLGWLVGAFFQHAIFDEDLNFYQNLTPFPFVPTNFILLPTYTRETRQQEAVFGNATYTLGPWVLEAGLRVEHDSDDLRNLASTINPLTELLTKSETHTLPRVSATYHINNELMSYGSISGGFTPGGVFNGQAGLVTYNAETTTNYELGMKGSALEGRIGFDADVFYINYRDRVFEQPEIVPPNPVVKINLGSSNNYGMEFSAQVRITSELTLSGGAGITKAIWDKATYVNPFLVPVDLHGMDAPFTPAYQANLALDWQHRLGGNVVFGLRADAAFKGRQYWDPEDLRQQRAYNIENLGVRLEMSRWELSAHVANLFDERYNVDYFYGPALGAPYDLAMLGQPRLWTARLAWKY